MSVGRRSEQATSTVDSPCFASLRGEVLESAPGHLRASFPVDAAWHNHAGVLQAGVLSAMMDATIDLCTRSVDGARQTATLELSTRFFRALRSGKVVVDATVLRAGRTTITVECNAWDEVGELAAKATATKMFLA